MSTLLEHRAAILESLEAGGIRTATTGQLAAPCVHVEPGDPWAEPVRMPGRLSRWRLTALAGRSDSAGALEALAELVDSVDAALLAGAGTRSSSLPTWNKPSDYAVDGVPYAGAVGVLTLTG